MLRSISKISVIIMISVIFSFSCYSDTISKDRLDERIRTAEGIISEDEGFLSDYLDVLTETQLENLFSEAFKQADIIANETINIKDDYEAYDYMYLKIAGENGLKDKMDKKARMIISQDKKQKMSTISKNIKTLVKTKLVQLKKCSYLNKMSENFNNERSFEKFMKKAANI